MKTMKKSSFLSKFLLSLCIMFLIATCDNNNIIHTHQWNWIVVQPASIDIEGLEIEICNLCDEPSGKTKVIPKLFDDPIHTCDTGIWNITVNADCENDGVKELRCSICNVLLDTNIIESHGHKWNEWDQSELPIYITADEEFRTCIYNSSHIEVRTGTPSLPITNTNEWNIALEQLNGKDGNYTININGDFGVTGITHNSFGNTTNGSILTVTIKGNGRIFLTSQGNIIRIGLRQVFIIDSEYLMFEGLTNGRNGSINNNNTSIIYNSGGTLELKNGIISGNYGGGIYISSGIFNMSGGVISENSATSGAGVYGSGTFNMFDGKIYDNNANLYGGGVYVNGIFIMNGGEIFSNAANNFGSGIYVDRNFTMNGGKIFNNTNSGVFVTRNGSFTMNNGEITNNQATVGGGIYIVNGNFIMNGGEIFSNTSFGSDSGGGGICVSGNTATFTMNGGEIYFNKSNGTNGSGVYLSGGAIIINSGEIYNNITTNKDGGGIFLNSGTLTMYGGRIYNNTVTGSSRNVSGGGIHVYGTFNMYGGEIFNNIATNSSNFYNAYGGGVFVGYNGTFNMLGGDISKNTATYGGGLYVSNNGNIRIITGTIYGLNEAENLRNNASVSAATLFINSSGSAQYGTLNGSLWLKNGDLDETDDTIKVINGVLQL